MAVQVIFQVGAEQLTTTLNPGERVLKAALKLELDARGFGECGGNCVCSTCHVYVTQGAEHFPAPEYEEQQTLDTVFQPQLNSRLACQLVVPANVTNPITVVVAGYGPAVTAGEGA